MICSADDKGFVDNVDELIELLTYNQDKIDWVDLSGNPNAIELLTVN